MGEVMQRCPDCLRDFRKFPFVNQNHCDLHHTAYELAATINSLFCQQSWWQKYCNILGFSGYPHSRIVRLVNGNFAVQYKLHPLGKTKMSAQVVAPSNNIAEHQFEINDVYEAARLYLKLWTADIKRIREGLLIKEVTTYIG